MDPPDQARELPAESNAVPTPMTKEERAKRRAEIIRALGFGRGAEREANARNRKQSPPEPIDE